MKKNRHGIKVVGKRNDGAAMITIEMEGDNATLVENEIAPFVRFVVDAMPGKIDRVELDVFRWKIDNQEIQRIEDR